MGADLLQPFAPFLPLLRPINPTKSATAIPQISESATKFCCCAAKSEREPDGDTTKERFKFYDRYNFADDGDYTTGFRSKERRRNWWSDDDSDLDDDEDENEDEEFWFWEDSGGIDWIFKVFRAFGWMVPAIIISMLVGAGPNTMIMALILPLGQSAVSLVIDKLWGSQGYSRNPRSKIRQDPFVRTASKTKPSERRSEASTRTSQARGSYKSWVSANAASSKKDAGSRSNFGGWDEFDEEVVGNTNMFSRNLETGVTDGFSKGRRNSKLSRRRNREKPLVLRLLIAMFPFLSSWTRIFL